MFWEKDSINIDCCNLKPFVNYPKWICPNHRFNLSTFLKYSELFLLKSIKGKEKNINKYN